MVVYIKVKTYCMHMYGSELWNLNCNYVDEFRVAWGNLRGKYGDYLIGHTMSIVQNLSYNIDDRLETRMINEKNDNEVCRSIS